ncbi:MAG: NADPH-dependent F420 reductase [Chloroflexi bacterium]|nr:NADPH-dependent F420 reductase [Chloroflexota bacterium]
MLASPLAFLGGTGPEGKGLALRLALAGEAVIIGSRDAGRAHAAAEQLVAAGDNVRIQGADNLEAASEAAVIFLTVPYEAQRPLLEHLRQPLRDPLRGKVVVSVIAPMKFERGRGASALSVAAGSAAEEAQQLLPDSLVVAAFQNVSAEELQDPDQVMLGDVVICSDFSDAKTLVSDLTRKIPDLRPVDGGGLANSKYVEQITPLLVNINRIYKIHAGIKIVGL